MPAALSSSMGQLRAAGAGSGQGHWCRHPCAGGMSCWAGNWGIILTNYTLLLITSNHFVTAVSCLVSLTVVAALAQKSMLPNISFSTSAPRLSAPMGSPNGKHHPSHPTHRWDHCAFKRRTEDVPLSIHFSLGNTNPRTSRMPKDEGVAELIREVSH